MRIKRKYGLLVLAVGLLLVAALTVLAAAPSITNPGDQTNPEGDTISLQIEASDDPDGHYPLTYSATGLPSDLSIGPNSGLISGTINFDASLTSPYAVQVTVVDSNDESDSITFSWTVDDTNRDPSATNPGDQTGVEGEVVSLQIAASDDDGDTLTYSATGLPSDLSIGPNNGLISGTISFDASLTSPYAVQVTVDDGNGGTDSASFSWTVDDTNRDPSATNPGDQTGVEGEVVSLQIAASDDDGDTLTYSATGLPPDLSIGPNNGLISGTINFDASLTSPYAVQVTVDDGNGGTDSASFSWSVDDTNRNPSATNPGDQTGAEGEVVGLQIAASDDDGDTLTYSATGLPPDLSIGPNNGLISGTINFDASPSSPYAVQVTVDDGNSGTDSASFSWSVDDTNRDPSATNPGDQTGVEGEVVSLQIAASDDDGDTLTYSATGLPSDLSIGPNNGLISGTINFDASPSSPYAVQVTVDDGNSGTDSASFSWSVDDTNRDPSATNPGDQTGVEGEVVSLQIAASDDDGDTLTYSATGLPPDLSIGPNNGLISGTINFDASPSSPYAVQVTVDDGNGGTDSASFSWTVDNTNRDPLATNPGDQTGVEGEVVSLQIAASDDDGDTLTYSATGLPSDLSIGPNNGLISGTINFDASPSSPYAVQVTVDDGNSGTDSASFSWTVDNTNRDPSVTDPGGQINNEGDTISLQIVASDPDIPPDDPLTYSATGLPSDLSIGPNNGLISGTINFDASLTSPYAVQVTVDDGNGGTDSASFSWTVAGVEINPTSLTISEPAGPDTFAITLSSEPTDFVVVFLGTSSTECSVSPPFVVLTPSNWESGVDAVVTAIDDDFADGDQICPVQVGPTASNDSYYDDLDPDDVSVTVLDDETASIDITPTSLVVIEPNGSGTFSLTLTSRPTDSVVIPLNTSSTECSVSPSSVTLDDTNWTVGISAIVTAVDDDIADGAQTCLVETGPSSSGDTNYEDLDPDDVDVTVHDDDSPGIVVDPIELSISEPDGFGTFSISLTTQPTADVLIRLDTSNNECSISVGSVTLDATNWETGESVTVTAVDDAIADGPQNCVVETAPSTSEDTNYNGRNPDDVTVTVLDDETAGIRVTPTSFTISEPAGSDSFIFSLTSEPLAVVQIPLSTSNTECSLSAASVTLHAGNWETGESVTVTAVDDDIADGAQTCLVETGPSNSGDNNYDGHDPDSVTVTVEDDDTVGIAVEPTSLIISEPDGSGAFTVTLSSRPGATVSIELSTSNGECTVSPLSIALNAGNWQTGVRGSITAEDDRLVDGDQACVVQTAPADSDDPQYQGLDVDDVAVTVQDDDRLWLMYMPVVARRWPPKPQVPTLNLISNPDGLGEYTVAWDSAALADTYILEESRYDTFNGAVEVYAGPVTSHSVLGRGATRYFYRVKARNAWGDSDWSNVEWVDVLWEAEPNENARIQANGPLVSGLTYFGTFPDAADEKDYFYFELPQSQTCELWLTNIPFQHNYTLILRDEQLDNIGYNPQPGSVDEYILTNLLPASRYYIQVFHTSGPGSGQPYHLRVVCQ